jgi:hypothetical protein
MRLLRVVEGVLLLTAILGLSSLGFGQAATFTANPNPVVAGQTVTFTGNPIIGVTATGAKVTLWFYNSAGAYIGSASKTGLSFTAGQPTTVTMTFTTASSLASGLYTYNLSYYNSSGTALSGASGQTNDGTFSVGTGTLHSACVTPVVVGLKWASVANATSYNVTRGGTTLASTAQLVYTDQTVKASTSYSYAVVAFNGSTQLSTQSLAAKTPPAAPLGDAAYCPSPVISGMTWNWSGTNQQDGSDLWSTTWGSDGNIYLFFGDGGGFYGSNSAGRTSFGLAKLTGSTPGLTTSDASNVYGGYNNTAHPATIQGKSNSIISIASNFYALGGIWQPSDPNKPADGSNGPNHYEIIYSNGNPYSWQSNYSNWFFCFENPPGTNQSNNTNPLGFCPVSFVEFGAGNGGAIDNYVYLLGATTENFIGNGGSCACTYLARVLNDNADILNKNSYQVLTGFNTSGGPIWSAWNPNVTNMYPIFVDNGPRAMSIGKMVYNSALQRFIAVGQGGSVNQAAFYDAPNPWGPFTSIAYFPSNLDNTGGWGNLGTTSFTAGYGDSLGINFMNKWTSSNGLTMWATFSSDKYASSNAFLVPLRGQDMDSFSLVSATLTLH